MLNTEIKFGSHNVSFNNPSYGMLQRSHQKSFFIRFQKGSEIERRVFPTRKHAKPFILNEDNKKMIIHVLQILIFGDDNYLCEVVREGE